MILCSCDFSFATNDLTSIPVWSFRLKNQEDEVVKAKYTGLGWPDEVEDFTICFRFNLHFSHGQKDGLLLFKMEKNSESFFRLFLYDTHQEILMGDSRERYKLNIRIGMRFRQWKSFCIVRSITEQKLEVYLNNVKIFVSNECKTSEDQQLNGTYPGQVFGKTCYQGRWLKPSGEEPYTKLEACTNDHEGHRFWCPVTINETTRVYDPSKDDEWGYCSDGCFVKNYTESLFNKPIKG